MRHAFRFILTNAVQNRDLQIQLLRSIPDRDFEFSLYMLLAFGSLGAKMEEFWISIEPLKV